MTGITAALVAELGRDEPVGLLGQLLYVFAGSGGRAAQAIGTTPATYNRWLMAARGTGGTYPSPASQRKITRAVRRVSAQRWHDRRPTRVTIHSRVEWNGYLNASPDRTVRLDGLRLGDMIDAYGRGPGTDAAVAAQFRMAVRERYGVPVRFTRVVSCTIS